MVKFVKDQDLEKQEKIHDDYYDNYANALRIIELNTNTRIKIKLCECFDQEHYYLMISRQGDLPGDNKFRGNFATPISLNQSSYEFKKEQKLVYSKYLECDEILNAPNSNENVSRISQK